MSTNFLACLLDGRPQACAPTEPCFLSLPLHIVCIYRQGGDSVRDNALSAALSWDDCDDPSRARHSVDSAIQAFSKRVTLLQTLRFLPVHPERR